MKVPKIRRSKKQGSMLITAMTFVFVSLVGSSAYLSVGVNEANMAKREANAIKAFYLAESGVEKIKYDIKVNTDNIRASTVGVPVNGTFTVGSLSNDTTLDSLSINTKVTSLGSSQFIIESSDMVGASTKTVTVRVVAGGSADVFNYAYCVNNWGWLYLSPTDHIRGDVFANGNFEVQHGPNIDGEIYAGGNITVDSYGINGLANDPNYRHANSAVIPMPRLRNLNSYENLAIATGGNVKIGTTTVITGVFGDDAGEGAGNIVLQGTTTDPITITGTVVVRNDVIVAGVVTGQGTIIAGRNIYIVDNITYKNPPTTPRPASLSIADKDAWVQANLGKDIACFAAKQNIVFGDYTYSGSAWIYTSYLFTFDREADLIYGNPQPGVKYSWSDINTSVSIASFTRCPTGFTTFSQIANRSISHIDGILYATHAIAGMLGNVVINGAQVMKDDSIGCSGVQMNHDERVSSRYIGTSLWVPSLQLPIATDPVTVDWKQS